MCAQITGFRMKLSDRMQVIADHVDAGETLADIGTDHGQIPVWLFARGICPKVILSDISEGSIRKAEETAAAYQFGQDMSFRTGDGLQVLRSGEADTVIIAGMGGMLMGQILETAWADPENGVHELHQMILEPQSDLPFFRELIRRSPMKIRDEILVQDRGKWYFIFDVCPKDSVTAQEEEDSFFSFSLLRRKDCLYRQYLEKVLQKNESLLTSMTEEGENLKLRKKELLTENEKIREVIDQWY